MSLRETCHCGHDKATHYREHGGASTVHASCLAMGCACALYVNEHDPKPSPPISPSKAAPMPDLDNWPWHYP